MVEIGWLVWIGSLTGTNGVPIRISPILNVTTEGNATVVEVSGLLIDLTFSMI